MRSQGMSEQYFKYIKIKLNYTLFCLQIKHIKLSSSNQYFDNTRS
jgi:hypothetical protein